MGMYNNMVGRVVGNSTGAKALEMMGPMAKGVSRHAGAASARMGMRGVSSSGVGGSLYRAGATAASAVARHPMRSIGAAGAGVGTMGAAGYGMHRRGGSQNYPMY